MSKKIKNGGSAFPVPPDFTEAISWASPGMTLRDHFAGLCMNAMLQGAEDPNGDYVASKSYRVADAMIAARGE